MWFVLIPLNDFMFVPVQQIEKCGESSFKKLFPGLIATFSWHQHSLLVFVFSSLYDHITSPSSGKKKEATKKTPKQNPQPVSLVTSAVGVWPERVGVNFQLGGNHAKLDSGLCSVWERHVFPGSSSLESILLSSAKARQPKYLPPFQLRSWACFRWAVRV